MKNLSTILLILFVSNILLAQETDDSKPEFKFKTETINYGKITSGADGVRVFEFTNIGKSPLIISRVQASCGCTVPKKPDQPIMPGEDGKIEVCHTIQKDLGVFRKPLLFSQMQKMSVKW